MPSRVVFRAVVHFVLLIRVFPLSLNIPRLRRHKFFPRFIFYCARARPFHSACPNDIFRLTAAFHQSLGFGPSFPFLLFFCQIQANQFLLRFFYVLSIFILYCLFIFYIELRRCLSRSRAILHVENWNFGAFFSFFAPCVFYIWLLRLPFWRRLSRLTRCLALRCGFFGSFSRLFCPIDTRFS